MKPPIFGRTPSKAEFHNVADSEFEFLVRQHGFTKHLSTTNDFKIRYTRDRCTVLLLGSGYGQNAHFELVVDGRDVPWPRIAPNYLTRFTPATDAPQLDLIRESAFRLREYFLPVIQGDYSLAEQAWDLAQQASEEAEQRRSADPRGTFFSTADRLWKNHRWDELISHLTASSYPLGTAWQQRLNEAQTHTRQ